MNGAPGIPDANGPNPKSPAASVHSKAGLFVASCAARPRQSQDRRSAGLRCGFPRLVRLSSQPGKRWRRGQGGQRKALTLKPACSCACRESSSCPISLSCAASASTPELCDCRLACRQRQGSEKPPGEVNGRQRSHVADRRLPASSLGVAPRPPPTHPFATFYLPDPAARSDCAECICG